METYVSGTAVKISSSSRCSSSSVLVFDSSSDCGSHDATSRWLRDKATFARLRITSDSDFDSDIFLLAAVETAGFGSLAVIGGAFFCQRFRAVERRSDL